MYGHNITHQQLTTSGGILLMYVGGWDWYTWLVFVSGQVTLDFTTQDPTYQGIDQEFWKSRLKQLPSSQLQLQLEMTNK
jgi:hypothetical protein